MKLHLGPAIGAAIIATSLLSFLPASAQMAADQLKVAYQAGRNQLGVVEYCQGKGYVGPEAIDTQRKLLGMIPAPADISGGDAAEAKGKQGIVSAMGIEQDLDSAAKKQSTTSADLCKKMGDALKQAAAALPK